MRLLSTVPILILGCTSAFADPVGQYTVQGTNPNDEGVYTGSVTVTRTGETYRVVWKIGDGETVGVGVGGRLMGSQYQMGPASSEDTVLSVAYSSGDTVGTALYSEDAEGVWHGTWAYDGVTKAATEVWTPTTKKLKIVEGDKREAEPRQSLSTPLPAQNSPRQ